MSISNLELTNKNLGLESNVKHTAYLVNKIFAFRQVLNGQPKKLINEKGGGTSPYFIWVTTNESQQDQKF